MSSIHGHEVLQMMIASDTEYSTLSLIDAIKTRFGKDSRFHTCSAENMSAEQLVEFLANRGKFIPSDSGFTTSANKICQH